MNSKHSALKAALRLLEVVFVRALIGHRRWL